MVMVTTPTIAFIFIVVYKSILASGTPLKRNGADDQTIKEAKTQEDWINTVNQDLLNNSKFKMLGGTNTSMAANFKTMQRNFVYTNSETVKQSLGKKQPGIDGLNNHNPNMSDLLQNILLLNKVCGQLKLLLKNFSRRHFFVNLVCSSSKYYRLISSNPIKNSQKREKRESNRRYFIEKMKGDTSRLKDKTSRDREYSELLDQTGGMVLINVTIPLNESDSNTTQNTLDFDNVHHIDENENWTDSSCQTFASCIHPFISYLAGTIMFILVIYLIILFGKCVCDDTY